MISSTNLYIIPYYDSFSEYYYHIIVLNNKPKGPLQNFVKLMKVNNASSKTNKYNSACDYVIENKILNLNTINRSTIKENICTIDDINEIYDYLINNNYVINNTITQYLTENIKIVSNDKKKLIFSFNYIS